MQPVVYGEPAAMEFPSGSREIQIPGRVPSRVLLAYRFVELCNCQMGTRGYPGMEGPEFHDMELHPMQESVFRTALGCLGEYFGGK